MMSVMLPNTLYQQVMGSACIHAESIRWKRFFPLYSSLIFFANQVCSIDEIRKNAGFAVSSFWYEFARSLWFHVVAYS